MAALNKKAKIIAIYFPQFHSIYENDEWWGKGFTDWEHVKDASSQFEGHFQPRVPLNNNYYDQSLLQTLRWQVALAVGHGVHGFCHYHYWFDGRQLLETPTNLFLDNKDIDFPFCLSWANETWSRRWDGRDNEILLKQTHPPSKERWKLHFDYLLKAWQDPRSIKVDGKPIFVIYRPHHIEDIDNMIHYWRELAVNAGLPGLYLIAQKQYEFPNLECLRSFDGIFQFQPFEGINASAPERGEATKSFVLNLARKLPAHVQDLLRSLIAKFTNKPTTYDYESIWAKVVEVRPQTGLDTFPGAFVDWDNTPRYKKRATILTGATPKIFRDWLARLVSTMPARQLPENFIFLNAWNEWSEGAYLEPDEKYGLQYLEAVKSVLKNQK